MHALSASDILWIWEIGQRKHYADRALFLLALAWPALSLPALNALTIGQRNAHVLALRQKTLGPLADCFARCPACNEQVEFTVDVRTMLPTEMVEPVEPGDVSQQVHLLDVQAYHLSFRVPTGADLTAAGQLADIQAGRALLLERCVSQATKNEQSIAVADIPDDILQALTEAILEHDPLAEMEFALSCPACRKDWTLPFDIVAFFWTELEAQAKRLMHDVHTIASAYGWRENDILALSSVRRSFYRELIR